MAEFKMSENEEQKQSEVKEKMKSVKEFWNTAMATPN